MFNINVPDSVKIVCNVLRCHGFATYLVGGCVRDSIMGIVPKDWALAANAINNKPC